MAHAKRRFFRSDRKATPTWWESLLVETSETATALGAAGRSLVLWQPPTVQQQQVTVLRIVGSITTSLQAASAVQRAVMFGIFVSGQGTGDVILQANDLTSDFWMYWKSHVHLNANTGEDGVQTQQVDIRVKRKLGNNRHLILTISCPDAAFDSTINLRGLLMESASGF